MSTRQCFFKMEVLLISDLPLAIGMKDLQAPTVLWASADLGMPRFGANRRTTRRGCLRDALWPLRAHAHTETHDIIVFHDDTRMMRR